MIRLMSECIVERSRECESTERLDEKKKKNQKINGKILNMSEKKKTKKNTRIKIPKTKSTHG